MLLNWTGPLFGRAGFVQFETLTGNVLALSKMETITCTVLGAVFFEVSWVGC